MQGQNTFTQTTAIVSFLLSIAAFLISSISFYRQHYKRSKITISFGDEIRLYYNHEKRLIFALNIIIANDGAKDGLLSKLGGTISDDDNNKAQFRWHAFWEGKDVAKEPDKAIRRMVFAGHVETIVIPKYGAVVKKIAFKTLEQFQLDTGKYELKFIGQVGFDFKDKIEKSVPLNIPEGAKAILDKSVSDEQGITKESLLLWM